MGMEIWIAHNTGIVCGMGMEPGLVHGNGTDLLVVVSTLSEEVRLVLGHSPKVKLTNLL